MPDDMTNFGSIYDWMENYELPGNYTEYNQDELLEQVYNEMTAGLEAPMDFQKWKSIYGKYIDEYNPAKEELKNEGFEIKTANTEELFKLKSDQIEEDYNLIAKYSSIDNSDNFESLTEMSIRHSKESEEVDKMLNRFSELSKGKKFTHKIKDLTNKQIKSSLRSGDQDALIDSVESAFWSDMKLARLEYDKKRLNRNQSLENLILKADQTMDKAEQSKDNKMATLLTSTEGKIKNAALDHLQGISGLREEFSDDLWTTVGDLAADEAFESKCAGVACQEGFVCNQRTGQCEPWTDQITDQAFNDDNTYNTEVVDPACMSECSGQLVSQYGLMNESYAATEFYHNCISECFYDDISDDW